MLAFINGLQYGIGVGGDGGTGAGGRHVHPKFFGQLLCKIRAFFGQKACRIWEFC